MIKRHSLHCYRYVTVPYEAELEGEYLPPFGAVGSVLDSVLLHRVADATVHRLLEDLGEELGARFLGGDNQRTQDAMTGARL